MSAGNQPRSTGPGPLPGTDVQEAARIVVGECSHTPFLFELPERGIGADLIGRTGTMLWDLPLSLSLRGWRIGASRDKAGRRARDLLDRDRDALHEEWERAHPQGVDNAVVQLRSSGPWSLAAGIELPGGSKVVTDSGARRDLAESLAEGLAEVAVDLGSRLGAAPRVVLDEPELWRIVAGTVPGASIFDPIEAIHPERLGSALSRFASALRDRGVSEVLVRAPGATSVDAPACWSVLTEPARGERGVDGIGVRLAQLADRPDVRPAGTQADGATRSTEAYAALDAVGTFLGEGRLVMLEGCGPSEASGSSDAQRTGQSEVRGTVQSAAKDVLKILDRVTAPRYETLSRITLSPSAVQCGAGASSAVSALRWACEVSDQARHFAE